VDLDAEHRPLVSPGTGQALYKFFVHLRHPDYRLVISADTPFPSGASEADRRHTRSREASDVNAEVRDAVARDGYSLFRIGLSLSDIP
jgi:hypothetical protein